MVEDESWWGKSIDPEWIDAPCSPDPRNLHLRGQAKQADYLVAADLGGYATESWVSAQGCSTETVDAVLIDLADHLSVDTASHEIAAEGANVFIQSGSGYTDDDITGRLYGVADHPPRCGLTPWAASSTRRTRR